MPRRLKLGFTTRDGRHVMTFASDLSMRLIIMERARRDGLTLSEEIRKLVGAALAAEELQQGG